MSKHKVLISFENATDHKFNLTDQFGYKYTSIQSNSYYSINLNVFQSGKNIKFTLTHDKNKIQFYINPSGNIVQIEPNVNYYITTNNATQQPPVQINPIYCGSRSQQSIRFNKILIAPTNNIHKRVTIPTTNILIDLSHGL